MVASQLRGLLKQASERWGINIITSQRLRVADQVVKKRGMFMGIEIGGTKLQLGVGDGHSDRLADLKRQEIDAAQGAMAILGDSLYVANRFSDSISLIDLRRGKRLGTVSLGPSPGMRSSACRLPSRRLRKP